MSETSTSPLDPQVAASAKDYVDLLKPRIMMLVVFTGLAGLLTAQSLSGDALPPVMSIFAVIAIALGSGAAGAINMWYDADIDAMMARTATRPIPSGRVPADEALSLGIIMGAVSVLLMWLASNVVAAGLLAVSIVYYGWLYTMVLKRRTPQNIVIGGAAGAFPPVIGWAAVTGTTPLDAWVLFAIIFFWTPPHFWALSLVAKSEYAKAGVPMLPVVRGAKATRFQILVYSALLLPVGLLPVATGMAGWIYAASAFSLGVVFLYKATELFRSSVGDGEMDATDRKQALGLFGLSILYLAGIFAALIVEHGFGVYRLTGGAIW